MGYVKNSILYVLQPQQPVTIQPLSATLGSRECRNMSALSVQNEFYVMAYSTDEEDAKMLLHIPSATNNVIHDQ